MQKRADRGARDQRDERSGHTPETRNTRASQHHRERERTERERPAFNVGDGPAAFLTLILGAIVVALAIALELTLHPPLWLHMLIWIPFTAAGVVLSLRAAKGALIAAEYRNAAREGRIQP